MNENGFIFISRNILEHQIFSSEKMLKIWIWCLCKATYKQRFVPLKIGKGQISINLERGQFIFGRHKAEEELFIDGSTIYKCMKKLEEFESIKIESNSQYSIITICNYDYYNTIDSYKVTSEEQPSNNQVTSKEQPKNTNKELIELNNIKENIYISEIEKLKNEIELLKKPKEEKKEKKKEYSDHVLNLIEFCRPFFSEKYLNGESHKCFDELIRIDNYSTEQIQKAIENGKKDDFWRNQFLSPAKLRTKNKDGILYIDFFINLKNKINNNNQKSLNFINHDSDF